MKEKEFYKAAVYLRLSREDDSIWEGKGSKIHGNSILSQKDMIQSYIKGQNNMEIYDIYTDNGFSGTNYDRPEFKRMMQDIEAGKVNCVIVKDLSRLGRDYIEAGRLIQKTFPAFSVRFIALTDHFDSLSADYNEKSLVVPVKNFVNDSYAGDISGKVRSHQKVRREKGDFIGAFTVYGYKKSKNNRNLLVPDDYAANMVRRIFAWKINGYSNLAIAKMLDGMGILSPMEYKKMQGEKYQTGFVTGVNMKWSAAAVKRILVNENYTGTLVQGKVEKVNYKIKKSVKKPEEEWTKVKNAHEAIISMEDFETVQELLKIDTRAGGEEKKAHIYAGILFCGDCREAMIRRVHHYKGKKTVSFICPTRNKSGACSRHKISEKDLNGLVLTGIRQQAALFLNKKKVQSAVEQMEVCFGEGAVFDREIRRLKEELGQYLMIKAGLHEDWIKGVITETDFKDFGEIYESRYKELQKTVYRQEETIKKLYKAKVMAEECLGEMKSDIQIGELSREMLLSFVKRILVYEDKRVYLEYQHKELFSKVVCSDNRE